MCKIPKTTNASILARCETEFRKATIRRYRTQYEVLSRIERIVEALQRREVESAWHNMCLGQVAIKNYVVEGLLHLGTNVESMWLLRAWRTWRLLVMRTASEQALVLTTNDSSSNVAQ